MRGYEALKRGFFDEDIMVRVAGDTICLAPSLIVEESEIGRLVDGVRRVITAVA